jgi:hypothetical protein
MRTSNPIVKIVSEHSTYMVGIILHEKLLVCRREMYLSFAPGFISGYKICKPLGVVAELFIEISLLTKMIRVAAINERNVSVVLTVITI